MSFHIGFLFSNLSSNSCGVCVCVVFFLFFFFFWKGGFLYNSELDIALLTFGIRLLFSYDLQLFI